MSPTAFFRKYSEPVDTLRKLIGQPHGLVGAIFVTPSRARDMVARGLAVEVAAEDVDHVREGFKDRPDPHGHGPTSERTACVIVSLQ